MAIIIETATAFQERLYSNLNVYRTPFSGTFELLSSCNFNCVHCYLGKNKKKEILLNTDTIIHILEQLAGLGCLSISFTGGEPLLRDDYSIIHKAAYKLGFWINLFTNASLVTPQIARLLAQYPPRAVEVSVYGASASTYEKTTGQGHNFEKFKTGIELLLKNNVKVLLKSVLLKHLLEDIWKIKKFAEEQGLSLIVDPCVGNTLEGDSYPSRYRCEPAISVKNELEIQKNLEKLKKYHRNIKTSNRSKDNPMCGAGFTGFNIDTQGFLSACILIRNPSFDLKKYSVKEAWEKIGLLPRPHFDRDSHCFSCDISHLCTYCPGCTPCAEDYFENGSFYFCELAKARAAYVEKNE